jgi:hypothetical protein
MNRPTLTLHPSIYKGWTLTVQINDHHSDERPIGSLTFYGRKNDLCLKSTSLDDLTGQIDRNERTSVKLTPPLAAFHLASGSHKWERVQILEVVAESFVYRREDGRESSAPLAALLPKDASDYGYNGRFIAASQHNLDVFAASNRLKEQIAKLSDEERAVRNQLVGLRESDISACVPSTSPSTRRKLAQKRRLGSI